VIIETSCKNCVFAVYDSVAGKDRQIDCYLNRIDLLEANGGTVTAFEDEDSEFVKILDRICQFHRTHEWAEIQDPEVELNLTDLGEVAREEARITFGVVLICEDEPLKFIVDTIESIADSTLFPKEFIVTVPGSRDDYTNIIKVLTSNLEKKCVWKLVQLNDKTDPYTFIYNKTDKLRSRYLCFARPGDLIDKHLFANVDILINEVGDRISTVLPNEAAQPIICQKELFLQLERPENTDDYEDSENPIVYLTKYTLDKIGIKHLSRTMGQICPPELSV